MMEENEKNYERGLTLIHTDYSITRYSPDLERIKVVPKNPLTDKEKEIILKEDFPALSKIYARAFAKLASAGETPEDLMQETFFKLPVYFARYDKQFLQPTHRKNINSIRRHFMWWFNLTARQYRDKTFENLTKYRDTKYGSGKNQRMLMSVANFEALHSVSNEEILRQNFKEIRGELWKALKDITVPVSRYEKDKDCNNIQTIIDMRDGGATIATIRFQFSQFGWNKDEQKEVLLIIEKYLDTLWERTHHFTGQEHSNWASDWLEAIESRKEAEYMKSQNKGRKVA